MKADADVMLGVSDRICVDPGQVGDAGSLKSTADAEVEEDADAMLGGLEESHAAEGSAIPTEPGAPGAGLGAAANSGIHK